MGLANAFKTEVAVFMKENASPKQQSAHLAGVAKNWLQAAQARGRVTKAVQRTVDGKVGEREEAVQPTGYIRYEFGFLAEAVLFALDYLKTSAPRKTGNYRESFFVSVNGKFIPADQFAPKSVPAGAEIIIGNTAPYHRKLEARPGLSARLPAGEMRMEVAALMLKRRFPNLIKAERLWNISFPGKYILKNEQHHLSGNRKGKSRNRAGKPVDSPALVITEMR